jgi:hypothetical protein
MSGSSRSSEMPRTLSQFNVIKNIISIFYTDKEDFTEFDEQFSNVGFDGFRGLYNDNLNDNDEIAIEAFGVLEDYLKNKVKTSEHETAYEAPKEETDEDLENYKDFGDTLLKAKKFVPHATYGDPTLSNKQVKKMSKQFEEDIALGMYESDNEKYEKKGGKKSKKTKKTKKIKKSKKTKKVRKNRKNKQSKRRQKR